MSLALKGDNELHKRFTYKDGILYWKINYGSAKQGDKVGYFNGRYYVTKYNQKTTQVARLIFEYHTNQKPVIIDHINGNKKDNHIENLRAASTMQNNYNKAISKRNKSGIKGISFCNQMKKWKAQITVNYKQIHLGYHLDKDLAKFIVEEAREKYHKQFACNGVRICL